MIEPLVQEDSTLLVFQDGHLAAIFEVQSGRNSVEMKMVQRYMFPQAVFCPCRSALVGPDHHSAKKVLILTMKLWKMKKVNEIEFGLKKCRHSSNPGHGPVQG
jgi:hypothetical protein